MNIIENKFNKDEYKIFIKKEEEKMGFGRGCQLPKMPYGIKYGIVISMPTRIKFHMA